MKKNFYLFSSIVFLTAFLGFDKANSYNLDKDSIAPAGYSKEGQTAYDLMPNINVNSQGTNLAYTGADELDAYWYGVGIGIAETLCYSAQNGYISYNLALNIMREYRNTFQMQQDFRNKTFEEGVLLAPESYPNCRL